MDWKTVLTLSITVLLALAGYVATYLNNLRLAQRRERLERINSQLRELYGPLFALVRTSTSAWEAFRSVYRPGGSFWRTDPPPNEGETAAWRLWMTEVFMPLNEEMVQIVRDHADMLEESEMPECLIALSAHVFAYKPVLKAWESGDYSRHTSVCNFPVADLLEYTSRHYVELKTKQAHLLGKSL